MREELQAAWTCCEAVVRRSARYDQQGGFGVRRALRAGHCSRMPLTASNPPTSTGPSPRESSVESHVFGRNATGEGIFPFEFSGWVIE